MMLDGKVAVVYGAGGAIGGAVARTIASEGARVFLAGRTMTSVDRTGNTIASDGGVVETANVDALDEQAVAKHLDDVLATAGGLDISFNAVGFQEIQGVPLTELSVEDFLLPIDGWAKTVFLTARAAARHMTRRGSGMILTINAPPGNEALSGGFAAASAAVGALTRTLASEVGSQGVRVLCLQPNAVPESEAFRRSASQHAEGRETDLETFLSSMKRGTLLHRLPTLDEVGKVAAFLASDRASGMTGTVVKVDCGSVVD
jgi:3-oxoacyl-[acyl-carrier protein] reductase